MNGRRRVWQATPVQPKPPERILLPPVSIRTRAEVAAARALRDSWPKTPAFDPPEEPVPQLAAAPSEPEPAPQVAAVTVIEPHPKPVTKAVWLPPKPARRTAK